MLYYHGTTVDIADKFLKTGLMHPSIGDDHWLGDGVYFYTYEEYAFRWILIKYTNNFSNEYKSDYSKIFKNYSILAVDISENARIWDLDKIQNKTFLIQARNEICQKMKYSKRFTKLKDNLSDGIIINILFEEMGFDSEYDVVTATFPISYCFEQSRLAYLPEMQVCVRNVTVIQNISQCNGSSVPDVYNKFINDYNCSKSILKERNTVHNIQRYKKKLSGRYKYNERGV